MADPVSAAAAELLQLSSSDSVYGSLSNFEIDRKIGKGQFSVVYRARCKIDSIPVALKKVQIFEMMDAKARLDCMKEIQLLQVHFSILRIRIIHNISKFERCFHGLSDINK